jgi:hypothetical protein
MAERVRVVTGVARRPKASWRSYGHSLQRKYREIATISSLNDNNWFILTMNYQSCFYETYCTWFSISMRFYIQAANSDVSQIAFTSQIAFAYRFQAQY